MRFAWRYGLRHLSGLPPFVYRTRSTNTVALGSSLYAFAIALACVGAMALERSELGRRTA
jgi:hypothetical protein